MLLVFALGIVLAVVSAGLWVSGQFGVNHIPIAFAWADGTTAFTHQIDLSAGAWLLAWEGARIEHDRSSLDATTSIPNRFSISRNWIPGRYAVSRRADAPLIERLGFTFDFDPMPVGPQRRVAGYVMSVPLWFPLSVGMTLAGLGARHLWRTRIRLRRRAAGQCESCGYDLRGAAHERCPECGETVVVPAHV